VQRGQRLVNATDVTGVNGTGAQSPFAAANDALAVDAASLYYFEFLYHLTHGATSHTTSVGLTLVTATLASLRGRVQAISAAADTLATPQYRTLTAAAAAVVTAASTALETVIEGRGHFRTTLGGTVSPFFQFSADPTGTILSKANSYFMLSKLGAAADVSIGGIAS
jgi:hypothetical protein